MSVDPLQKMYLFCSPFVFGLNSPISIIDIDGEKIVIVGTPEYQQKVLQTLQKLTNDKLVLKNGVVYIEKLNAANPTKSLPKGTSLIRELNKKGDDAKTLTILSPEEYNKKHNYSTSTSNGTNTANAGINGVVDPYTEKYKSNIKPDGTPGLCQDADIRFNVNELTEPVPLEDGTIASPALEDNLTHE